MNSILERIAEHKKKDVLAKKLTCPVSTLTPVTASSIRDFEGALRMKKPAIIAEIKRASPSKGIIRDNFDVATIATIYSQHGACCLSVLTDEQFFHGKAEYLSVAKAHCQLPVLRKDFLIDEYQIYESSSLGADCILLIVALLDDIQLRDYCELAQSLGMSVLVESHTLAELERAIVLPTALIGINNRSLHTFSTDIQLSIDLSKQVPANKIVITESGINTPEEIALMQSHGIQSFLIGESLMREEDIGLQLDRLIGKKSN